MGDRDQGVYTRPQVSNNMLLDRKELQVMRDLSVELLSHLVCIGSCNCIIAEMNERRVRYHRQIEGK